MTAEVRGLLKTRDEAFRSRDKVALKTARANLSCGIKNAKRSYAQKINNHFTDSRDTRSLWQAIQTITDYKPPPQACDDDPSLPDTLNHFYSRFEMQNDTPAQKHILQGHHWECADQLHHCLLRELQCCWPQDPPADSEHGCKDHRCPSPIHPGHFPCTMLQQNQQHHEGPHPPLPQSLPAPTIRKTVPEHQSPLRQTAQQLFPPGCESPELKLPRPPLKPHTNPYLLKHGPSHPPPPPLSKHPPNLTTPKKNWTFLFFCSLCNSSVLHTGEWACTKPPVVTHSPLCALDTFHTLPCVHNPTKDSAIYVCLQVHLNKLECREKVHFFL